MVNITDVSEESMLLSSRSLTRELYRSIWVTPMQTRYLQHAVRNGIFACVYDQFQAVPCLQVRYLPTAALLPLLLLRWLSIEFVRWKNRLSNFRIAQFLFRKQQDMQYISLLKTRNPPDATNLHKCSQQRLPVIQSVFLNSNFLVTAKHSKLPLNYVWITFYFYSFRASTF